MAQEGGPDDDLQQQIVGNPSSSGGHFSDDDDDDIDLFLDDEELEHRRELAAVINNMRTQLSQYASSSSNRGHQDDDDEPETLDQDIRDLETELEIVRARLVGPQDGHDADDEVDVGDETDMDTEVPDDRLPRTKKKTSVESGHVKITMASVKAVNNQVVSSLLMADDIEDLTDHEHEEDFSMYENKSGLAEDMKFLASMPELCDVTFLVGETREPVCAVKAVLAARSRVFQKLLYHHRKSPSNLAPGGPDLTGKGNSSTSPSSRESSHEDHLRGNRRESDIKQVDKTDKASKKKSKKLKEAAKDTKLKLFLKRSSEPFLDGLPFNQAQSAATTHQTMIIEEFEPDVFRQLIEYIHTGCVTLQARTLLGLMNAADYYGLEELRKGCINFVTCCINVDTVCALLASAERYIQYKCTKSLVQRVLEFVDHHGNEVLSLGSFAMLPEHVVRLILSREELKADELTKFQAALHWSQRYCDHIPGSCDLRDVIANFYECIEFYKIPATVLMREVHPLGVVPDHMMMNALAFQADPASIDFRKVESPSRFRRMTLPHSNLAAVDLHRLRQCAGGAYKSERSASTSTSGYAGSSDSANHISLIGNTLLREGGCRSAIENDENNIVREEEDQDSSRRSSSALAGTIFKVMGSPSKSAEATKKISDASSISKKEDKKEKDRLARYLAKSTRRASRPFRRAKTLLLEGSLGR